MIKHRTTYTLWLAVAIATAGGAAADLPGTGEDTGKTVVYRDHWGVPHIYAPTVEAGLYAMGWAQAQDRPEELLKNFSRAMGKTARFDGKQGLRFDIVARMWDHYGVSQANMDKTRSEIRGHVRAFAQGMNDFYKAHPDDLPEWWTDGDVDEAMVAAFGRIFLYSWSIDQGFSDLRRGGIAPDFAQTRRWSNQWALSPSRSATGSAILLIDPHLSWWGISRFWEFRIHAGALNGSGFTLPGSPYIGLGHNEYIAWAMTTGGPDTADVYELSLNPDDATEYRYDGEWRKLTTRTIQIEVKDEGTKEFTLLDSHYGPVVAVKEGKAYSIRSSYADATQVNEAWYHFNFAKDYRGAVAGMDTLTVFPQNVMVADTSGNIYYQRTGRVPKRPGGYDWNRPVDGSTSATEWLGLHPASDHLQVLNPPQGYMQNCNIPPDAMMVNGPFSPGKTLPYLYGSAGGSTNQRGARALQLLRDDDSVTIEEALQYAVDVHPYGVERWLDLLRAADEKFGGDLRKNHHYAEGIDDLLGWDMDLRRDSSGALKYYHWRSRLPRELGAEGLKALTGQMDQHYLIVQGTEPPPADLTDDQLRGAAAAFAAAMEKLEDEHGSQDAVFGDKFRVGRGGRSWPVGGGGGRGMSTLRSIAYGGEKDDGTRWGRAGQTSTEIVVMTEPIQSWTYVPIGQSDRPDSPHYRDQAEKLFSKRQMKPSRWLPEDLEGHIESRTVLDGAP